MNDRLLRSSTEYKTYLDSDKIKYQEKITKLDSLLEEKDLIIKKMEQEINVLFYHYIRDLSIFITQKIGS